MPRNRKNMYPKGVSVYGADGGLGMVGHIMFLRDMPRPAPDMEYWAGRLSDWPIMVAEMERGVGTPHEIPIPEVPSVKMCTQCEEPKSASQFSMGRGRLGSWCLSCQRKKYHDRKDTPKPRRRIIVAKVPPKW